MNRILDRVRRAQEQRNALTLEQRQTALAKIQEIRSRKQYDSTTTSNTRTSKEDQGTIGASI